MKTTKQHLIILMTLVGCLLGWSKTVWAAVEIDISGSVASQNITENTTWNVTGTVNLRGTITIKSGFTLTIQPDKDAAANRTIRRRNNPDGDKWYGPMFKVEAGASLVINRREVSGTYRKIILDGGATFEDNDARNGVPSSDYGGGCIIQAIGDATINYATIRNCYSANEDGELHPYGAIYCAESPNSQTLKLTGVTIQACLASAGAAVKFQSKDYHTATFTNTTIRYCYAKIQGTESSNGIIRTNGNTGANLTLDGCSIYENKSDGGGALYWNAGGRSDAKLTIKGNTKIYNNEAKRGGAIHAATEIDLQSVEIYNNTATQYGGGIYMYTYTGTGSSYTGDGFDLTIKPGVSIHDNTAASYGGGICLIISQSDDVGFKNNSSNTPISPEFKFTMNGGNIYNNESPLGGGIAILDKAPYRHKNKDLNKWSLEYKRTITVSGGYINDNRATSNGGGVYIRKYVDSDIGTGTDQTGYTYADANGAGTINIYLNGGNVYNNGIKNNVVQTQNGGGIYITDEMGKVSPYNSVCNVTVGNDDNLSGANVYQNQATNTGGAIYINNGVFTMKKGTIGGSTANANKVTATNSKGGGFYITGAYSNVSISGGSVTYNTATATGGLGGGFYVNNSSSTGTSITGSAKVTNNQATSGGGAYINEGTLTVNGSSVEIKSNKATAGNGGGIFANGGTVTLTAGSIANNTATGSGTTGLGGGIYSKGNLTIQGATIGGTAATAKNSAYDGAGVYVAGGTVSHTSGSVRFNEASHNGGGIYSTDGTVTINGANALVADNQAAEQGGGIWAGGTVNLQIGLIQRNKATSTTAGKGGGVYVNNSTFKMTGGTIGGTTTSDANTVPFQGGGVYITGANAKVQVQGGTISYNTATGSNGDGGGIYVASTHADGTSVTNSSNITNNTANHDGGGLYVANGKLTVDASTISSNTATNGSGGGVYAVGTVTVTGGTISSNHADKTGNDCGLGGGIYAEAGSNTITIESSSSITGNTAQYGAGLYAASGTVDVKTNSTITSNAASQNGGGIYANGGTVNVSATTNTTEILKQNTAVNGGGIYANGGTVNFSNGVIKNNYASHWGGGLYIPATGKLTLKGTATITGNRVPAGMHGGGVYLAGVVEVGSASKANTDILKVEDNYADDAGATVTNDNRNNIYLPNPVATPASSSNPHVDVITIFNTGINTTSSSVGFSVPRNFVPVIYCSDANYLAGLVDNDGILQGTYIFEDSHKYTAYYHNYAPYDANHIYLSSGTWVNHVTAQPATGFSVDENGDVTISNEEGLAWLISYVNGLNDVQGGAHAMAGKTVSLTADVNMGDYAWVPIGSMIYADAFKGTFDGNGHTISNIYCMYLGNQVTGQNLGMFGVANDNAIIKNVFLEDAEYTTLDQTTGSPYVGGLVETLGGSAKIYNCGVDAKLESLATGSVMGGLVGKMEGGEIHSAFAVAEMTGYTMGGLVGQITSGNLYNNFANPQFNYSGPYSVPEDPDADINLYVGGLVAENSGTVANCYVRFSRTNTGLANAMFGQLAGDNTDGVINPSYTPETYTNVPATIVHTGNSATSNTYKVVDAPYKYNRPNDNKVGGTNETLTEKLNEWVSGQHSSHPDYAYWKRTTAGGYGTGGNINDDYPIHKMVGLSNAASPDGLFIEYKYSLDAMLTKYNDLENGGTVWVYDSPLSTMTASGGTPSYESVSVDNAAKVKLYIDEEASLLQSYDPENTSANNTLTAYTGQTLRNYSSNANRWHNVSSSLKQSGIGFTYGTTGQVPFNWDVNPCSVTLSSDNDNAFFPSDLPWPATAEMDFYCFYEPEYHWINLKRNTGSHWHMNATTVPIVYNGNGIGASTNGNETYMVPGKGYLVSIDKDQLIQNKGELNNGTVALYSVTKTDYNAWAGLLGYNLLGNPYQSYLDFEQFKRTNSGLWTTDPNEYNQTYATFDPEQNAYRQYFPGVSSDAKTASQYIHPHQGFFIRKTAANSGDNTVTFTNAMRTNDTDGQSGFRGAGQPRHALVNFVVRDAQGNGDIAVLELNRDGDEGAEKIRMGDGTGHLSLGYESKAYAILFRTKVDGYQPLWFEATEAGTFTLGWDIHNAVFESLTLVDNIAGTSTDMLATDSYTFQGSPDHYASRFKVVIGDYVEVDPDAPVEPEPVEGPTFAFIVGDELVVDGEGTLQVFDVMGRQLSSTTLSGTRSTVGLPTAATGVYVLRLTNENGTKVQKIVFGN